MNLYNLAHLPVDKDEELLIAAAPTNRLLAIASGQQYWVYATDSNHCLQASMLAERITALRVSSTEELIALGTESGHVYLWWPEKSALAQVPKNTRKAIAVLGLATNGLVASADTDSIEIWDYALPGLIKSIPISKEFIVGLNFDSQNHLLVTSSQGLRHYRSNDFEVDASEADKAIFQWRTSSIYLDSPDAIDRIVISSAGEASVYKVVESGPALCRCARYIGTRVGAITGMTTWRNLIGICHQVEQDDTHSLLQIVHNSGACQPFAGPVRFHRPIIGLASTRKALFAALSNGLVQGLIP